MLSRRLVSTFKRLTEPINHRYDMVQAHKAESTVCTTNMQTRLTAGRKEGTLYDQEGPSNIQLRPKFMTR